MRRRVIIPSGAVTVTVTIIEDTIIEVDIIADHSLDLGDIEELVPVADEEASVAALALALDHLVACPLVVHLEPLLLADRLQLGPSVATMADEEVVLVLVTATPLALDLGLVTWVPLAQCEVLLLKKTSHLHIN